MTKNTKQCRVDLREKILMNRCNKKSERRTERQRSARLKKWEIPKIIKNILINPGFTIATMKGEFSTIT